MLDADLTTIREVIHTALRTRDEEMARAAIEAAHRYDKYTPILGETICRSSGETYRHLLVPVYLVATRHGDAVRQVRVSGIDGSVAARTPISAWKIGVPLALIGALGLWPWLRDLLGV